MTFEDDTPTGVEGEGTGESTDQTSQADSQTQTGSPEAQTSDTSADKGDALPEVDYGSLDIEALYKARPELKPATVDEVLNSEEVRKRIQSEKDKEIARERRRLRDEQQKLDRDEKFRRIEAEKRRLREEEDFEGLGKYVAEEDAKADELLEAASVFKETGERYIREHPDYQVLGDDRLADIIDTVKARGGNVFDIQVELAKALADERVGVATTKADQSIEERIEQEVAAALLKAGVTKREAQVQAGETASQTISGGGAPKASTKGLTYADASRMYGDGEMSTKDFEPYRIAHDNERNM